MLTMVAHASSQKMRQEGLKFKASLGYKARPCLKKRGARGIA
jgi:hypothetical protein